MGLSPMKILGGSTLISGLILGGAFLYKNSVESFEIDYCENNLETLKILTDYTDAIRINLEGRGHFNESLNSIMAKNRGAIYADFIYSNLPEGIENQQVSVVAVEKATRQARINFLQILKELGIQLQGLKINDLDKCS